MWILYRSVPIVVGPRALLIFPALHWQPRFHPQSVPVLQAQCPKFPCPSLWTSFPSSSSSLSSSFPSPSSFESWNGTETWTWNPSPSSLSSCPSCPWSASDSDLCSSPHLLNIRKKCFVRDFVNSGCPYDYFLIPQPETETMLCYMATCGLSSCRFDGGRVSSLTRLSPTFLLPPFRHLDDQNQSFPSL
jgi:hypothetical protein